MIPLSPQLLVSTTLALAGMGAQNDESFGVPAPAPDEPVLGELARPRESWDLKFVQRCGYWSHYDIATRTSSWPIPYGMTPLEMARFGAAAGILHRTPAYGDIFLQYSLDTEQFGHVGVVAKTLDGGVRDEDEAEYFDLYTIEGDTDQMGRPGRGAAVRLTRRLTPDDGDRFLRWSHLDNRDPDDARSTAAFAAVARMRAQ